MSQTAKAQEPSMEEILASIRRIIADDDSGKGKSAEAPAAKPPAPTVASRPVAAPPPMPAPVPRPVPVAANKQEDVDAMLADFDSAPNAAAKPAPAPVPPPKPVEAVAPPPPAAPDVLDLTEAMAAQAPSPDFRTIDGASDVVFADRSMDQMPPPAAETRMAAPEQRRPPAHSAIPDHGLISSATMTAVDSAFNSLAHTVLGNNARTLEDLVKEMLRPMLKSWLDDNLPGLVERIVRAEIERVSRGRP
ncbi:MAG: DUF2497 domain-containing protein [Pseudolabrys sp.]|nr:DUF2497 domain-containing protein [Pseudolabrys sp.]